MKNLKSYVKCFFASISLLFLLLVATLILEANVRSCLFERLFFIANLRSILDFLAVLISIFFGVAIYIKDEEKKKKATNMKNKINVQKYYLEKIYKKD